MSFNFRKSVTFQLSLASKAYRARSGAYLSKLGLHPGQDSILKILDEEQGRTMGQLATALGVQPPTVAKMVNRLTSQGLVRRDMAEGDGRIVRVYLTEEGEARLVQLDKSWKRLEREALDTIEDKDRRKLRKLLRLMEKNLTRSRIDGDGDVDSNDDDFDTDKSPSKIIAEETS